MLSMRSKSIQRAVLELFVKASTKYEPPSGSTVFATRFFSDYLLRSQSD